MKLTRRLFALSLVALAPAIGVLTYNQVVTRRDREAEVRDLATRNARQAASELEGIVEGVRVLLTSISKVEAIQNLDAPSCAAYLSRLQPEVPHLVFLSAIDLQGVLRCRSEIPPNSPGYADRPYFQQALATGRFTIGEFSESRISKRLMLPIASPLKNLKGDIVGTVATALDLSWLSQHLRERGLPPDGSITVADRNGVIIARQPFPERFVGTRIPDEYMSLVSASTPGAVDVLSQDGTRRVLGYVPEPVSNAGLYVSVGLSSEASFAPVDRAARQSLLLIILGALMAFSGAWLFGRRFIERPIQNLLRTARAWRSGNLSARSGLTAQQGELGALGEEFDRVVAEVAAREGALRESETRFRELADSAPVLIWMLGPDKGGVYFNKPWLSFTGRTLEQQLGEGWLDDIHPKDLAVLKSYAQAFVDKRPFQIEFRMRRHDGEWRWMLDTGVPRFSLNGEFQGFIGSCIDITERQRHEQRQRLLLNELNHRVKNTLTTVQSLAAHTLRTSHDLQDFRRAFESRLLALSKTHDLLTAQQWEGASLTQLIEFELEPYISTGDRSRLTIKGKDIQLPPKYAVALGLSIHELATNAVKYGALSAAQGKIEVSWQRVDVMGVPHLKIAWTESDGPPVAPPKRLGFGSRLIERSIGFELQGKVKPIFEPDGLRVQMDFPLPSELLSSFDPAAPIKLSAH
jgi:PAS domain S-box-containing protein